MIRHLCCLSIFLLFMLFIVIIGLLLTLLFCISIFQGQTRHDKFILVFGQSKKNGLKRDIGPHYFLPYPNIHSQFTRWPRSLMMRKHIKNILLFLSFITRKVKLSHFFRLPIQVRPSQFFSLFLIGQTLENLPSLPEKTNERPRKKNNSKSISKMFSFIHAIEKVFILK